MIKHFQEKACSPSPHIGSSGLTILAKHMLEHSIKYALTQFAVLC